MIENISDLILSYTGENDEQVIDFAGVSNIIFPDNSKFIRVWSKDFHQWLNCHVGDVILKTDGQDLNVITSSMIDFIMDVMKYR